MPKLASSRSGIGMRFDSVFRQDGPLSDAEIKYIVSHNQITLFGNRNVGNFNLSNMLVAGQFPGDIYTWFTALRSQVEFSNKELRELVLRYFEFTLYVGDIERIGGILPTLEHPVPLERPIECPPRQSYRVTLDWSGSNDDLARLFKDPGFKWIRFELWGVWREV